MSAVKYILTFLSGMAVGIFVSTEVKVIDAVVFENKIDKGNKVETDKNEDQEDTGSQTE